MTKHQQQHRSQSEEKQRSRQLVDLKRENQSLKRKISKLQKYLQKVLESGLDPTPAEESPEHLGTDTSACPACGSHDLGQVALPGGTLRVCKSCGWRKKH